MMCLGESWCVWSESWCVWDESLAYWVSHDEERLRAQAPYTEIVDATGRLVQYVYDESDESDDADDDDA